MSSKQHIATCINAIRHLHDYVCEVTLLEDNIRFYLHGIHGGWANIVMYFRDSDYPTIALNTFMKSDGVPPQFNTIEDVADNLHLFKKANSHAKIWP